MKPFITLFLCTLTFNFIFGQRECGDPLISEIVYSSDGAGSYAVEIFNPSDLSLDLTNYKLELLPEQGSGVSIPLSGTLLSGDVAVVTTQNAITGIDAVADIIDNNIAFDDKAVLQLVKGASTVIDRVGNQGEGISIDQIDFSQLDDPIYVASLSINLKTIQDIVVRRKKMVRGGKPVFINEDILKDWTIYPNLELSNLGQHVNACVAPILQWKEWNFTNAHEAERTEDDLNPVFGTIESSEELTADITVFFTLQPHEFILPVAEPADFFDYTTPLGDPTINHTLEDDNSEWPFTLFQVVFNGDEVDEGIGMTFQIASANGTGAEVEDGKDVFDLLIRPAFSNTKAQLLSSFLKVYPSVVTTMTTIEVSGDNLKIQKATILDSNGRMVKAIEYADSDMVTLDFTDVPSRGFFTIMVQTNKGTTAKKILRN